MTIKLHDGATHDGLMDVQGHAFYLQQLLDVARVTTIPAELVNVLTGWALLGPDKTLANLTQPMIDGMAVWQGDGQALFSGIQMAVQNLLIQMANEDTPLSSLTVPFALSLLCAQMVANAETVEKCTVTAAATAVSENQGNGVMLVTVNRGDGRTQETAYAETIAAKTSGGGILAPFVAQGQPGVTPDSLAWPSGSGSRAILATVSPAGQANLVANGTFEAVTTGGPNVPDSWTLSVGTPGNQCNMTVVEVQQIAITGTPTAGFYTISWQNPAGKTQTTAAIAFNATAATVQQAMQALIGLGSVTVVATGTTPNWIHTITFNGVGGDIQHVVTINNQTTGGTFTPSTLTAGTGLVFDGGRSLQFLSDGANLTEINQGLANLVPNTVYGVSLWAACDFTPLSGIVTVDLVDGIGGSVIDDGQGIPNSFTIPATSLIPTWVHASTLASTDCCFRTPAVLPPIVYLRIRISSAVDAGSSIYFDDVAVAALPSLYSGGPLALPFGGSVPFAAGDAFSIAIANDYGGKIQTAYNRFMSTGTLGVVLPSSGAPTISDSLIGA